MGPASHTPTPPSFFHLNVIRYQRAYVDFFDDEFVLNGYDWKKVLDRYMFEGKEPLINGIFADC